MTERGGEHGGRSSAKAGPAAGRGRGVSPDAAGSEVGSGMTGLLSVPTRPLLRAEGSCAFASCRAHALGPPAYAPTPQAWFLPALPSFPVRTIFAMLLGAMARCSWCHQHATLARARHAGIPLQEDPVPACQRPTQYRMHHPVLASSQQLRAPRGVLDAGGAPGSLLPPASLPKLPAAPRATSLLQASTLGGSSAWNPPPTVAHPRGSPCWCLKLSVGRAGRPPRPRGASEVATVGLSLCGVTPKEESGCGNRVTLARRGNSRMSRAGEGGAGLSGTPLGPHSPEQVWGPARALWEEGCDTEVSVSTALEFLATLGHGLDMRVRVRPAQDGLGRPKGQWEQQRSCTRPA